jgi:polysaccharide pyruvyl transferase WcaK-like protein
MNIIVTGYYQEKNLGDDLFEQIGKYIFTEKVLKQKINNILFMKIDRINSTDIHFNPDKLILFGGETMNDYFLDKIIKFKQTNPLTELYAIGVSANQSYELIQNKINIFNKIIFRNKLDYEYFEKRLGEHVSYSPDIVFTTKYSTPFFCNYKSNNAGIFVAMPLYCNLKQPDKELFLKNIRSLIDKLLEKSYRIYFFPMCCNEKQSEDDLILIKKITEIYTPSQTKKFKYFTSNKKIVNMIPKMKINFCWRFHSAILSIVYNVPFITFSNTPKVKNLLKDFELNNLTFELKDSTEYINYLEKNLKQIKKKLKLIYKDSHKKAIDVYTNYKNYNNKRDCIPFYIDNIDCKKIIDYVLQVYNKNYSSHDDDYNTNLIIFTLMRNINTKYFYGLRQKIHIGIKKLEGDIKWLIDDLIASNCIHFYNTANEILNKFSTKQEIISETINMNYINQFEYEGLHRAGWSYVLNNLQDKQHQNGIICDFYVDRTFHWNNKIFSQLKVIPYTKPWIGFIHHTTDVAYSEYNTLNLFENKNFVDSLKMCKGLIVLSKDLESKLKEILIKKSYITPVFQIYHPTEFVPNNLLFNLSLFKKNQNKKIIQIGAWMRDIEGIFKLKLDDKTINLVKTVLIGKKMEGYYNLNTNLNMELLELEKINCISRDNKDRQLFVLPDVLPDVEIIQHLSNDEYDILLSSNIVFIKLVGASAVNTIIECIVRNTPIVVNKLPAIVEILGEHYPLYYTTLEDATTVITLVNIEKAYNYLKKLDKTVLKIETFKKLFDEILKKLIF